MYEGLGSKHGFNVSSALALARVTALQYATCFQQQSSKGPDWKGTLEVRKHLRRSGRGRPAHAVPT